MVGGCLMRKWLVVAGVLVLGLVAIGFRVFQSEEAITTVTTYDGAKFIIRERVVFPFKYRAVVEYQSPIPYEVKPPFNAPPNNPVFLFKYGLLNKNSVAMPTSREDLDILFYDKSYK